MKEEDMTPFLRRGWNEEDLTSFLNNIPAILNLALGLSHPTERTVSPELGREGRRAKYPPFALVLTGKRWSARNETADLARSFRGRLCTELTH